MPPSLERSTEMRAYLRPLRMGVPLAVLLATIAAAAAWVLTPSTTPAYLSVSKVLVGPGVTSGTAGPRTVGDVVTEAELVQSVDVAARAVHLLEWEATATEALSALDVVTSRDSQVLSLRYTADTPQRAQDGADAFTRAYLTVRQDRLAAPVEARRSQLETELATLRDQLVTARAAVDAAEPGSTAVRTAEADRDLIASQVQSVTELLMALDGTVVDAGRVIQPAEVPEQPIAAADGGRTTMALVAAALAALLGIVVAYAMAGASDRIRGVEELESMLVAPYLGEIGRLRRTDPLPVLDRPDDPTAETVRHVREGLLAALAHVGGRELTICDAGTADVSGAVAANLASAIARSGREVVVVSADRASDDVELVLGARQGADLGQVLRADDGSAVVLHAGPVPGLRVVRRGEPADVDLLERPDAVDRLRRVADGADLLLVLSGHVDRADAISAARGLGSVVLVVPPMPRRRDLAQAHRRLATVGARPLGVVVARGWRRGGRVMWRSAGKGPDRQVAPTPLRATAASEQP